MALNQNHTFDDLEGEKCSIVEKNCTALRVAFLKELLEHNNFKVITVSSPPAKAAIKPKEDAEEMPSSFELPPETYTIGVTDVSFNLVNALFNRELVTKDGNIVTPEFWKKQFINLSEDSWYWNS